MNILILCRDDDRPEYDQIDTYSNALSSQKRSNTYTYGKLEELVFSYDGKLLSVFINGRDVSDFDAVFMIGWFKTKILEDIALSAALYAANKNVKVLNSEVLHTRSRSKLSQYVYAAIHDISMKPFMFCKDVSILKRHLETWSGGYPVIAKGLQSSRGNDNYKIDDFSELKAAIDRTDLEIGPWLVIQGFVQNDGDYRIIVMGDRVVLVIHRISIDGSHLNNTSKGGVAKIIDNTELPAEVLRQSVTLAKAMKREITGVDMIRDSSSGKFYLLEVNNMPQLATGAMVQQKMQLLDNYFSSLND